MEKSNLRISELIISFIYLTSLASLRGFLFFFSNQPYQSFKLSCNIISIKIQKH